jgi:hypothetical protein
MSFERKIRRKAEKKRIKGETGFHGKNEFTDKIIDFLEGSAEVARVFAESARFVAKESGVLIGPMDLCLPIVHVENQEWTKFFGIEAGQFRAYARDGYLSGTPVLTQNVYNEVFFAREQMASELALGRRVRPDRQGTCVVFHADGTAEFFYFMLPMRGMSTSHAAEDLSHGDDTSVSFG